MVEDIRGAMEDTIESVSWMDDQTRRTALEKVRRIESLVGYPDYMLVDSELNKRYKQVGNLTELFTRLEVVDL